MLAIAGPQLADDSFRSPASLLILAGLALGLQLLAAFLYLAVIRLNAVLRYYLRIVFTIRDVMIPAAKELVDLEPLARPPDPVRPWAGTSNVAENVLRVGLVAFPVVLAGVVVRSIDALGWSATTTWFCAGALVLCLLVGLRVRFGGLREPEGQRV